MIIYTPIELLKRIEELELWIHLHPASIAFLLFDKQQNKIYEIETHQLNKNFDNAITNDFLVDFFSNNNELFSLSFSKVKIAFSTNKFAILPIATNNLHAVFNYLNIDTENKYILDCYVSEKQMLYFLIDNRIKKYFENRFRNVQWFFGDYGILKTSNNKLTYNNHILCSVHGNDLTIALKKNNETLYFNKFYIEQKQDLLYFLQLTYQQLGLDTNQFPTYIYGQVEEKSPMYAYAFEYIRNIEIDRTLKYYFNYDFTYPDKNLHYFYNLLALGR